MNIRDTMRNLAQELRNEAREQKSYESGKSVLLRRVANQISARVLSAEREQAANTRLAQKLAWYEGWRAAVNSRHTAPMTGDCPYE